MRKSELQNGVFDISNARTHASYMLRSTTRKSTLRLWVIPYEMCLSPKMKSTLKANLSACAFRANCFCSYENSTTRIAVGSISSRCTGNEPALLPRTLLGEEQRPDAARAAEIEPRIARDLRKHKDSFVTFLRNQHKYATFCAVHSGTYPT